MIQTVDEFAATRVQPELQAVVAMVRELMHESSPDATETISYGLPVYKGKKIWLCRKPLF